MRSAGWTQAMRPSERQRPGGSMSVLAASHPSSWAIAAVTLGASLLRQPRHAEAFIDALAAREIDGVVAARRGSKPRDGEARIEFEARTGLFTSSTRRPRCVSAAARKK
jgi:hypothetical protein